MLFHPVTSTKEAVPCLRKHLHSYSVWGSLSPEDSRYTYVHENLVFQQQKLHQITDLCTRAILGGWALWLSSMWLTKRNVYSYMESHVLSTVFIQSICRKHPRLPVSICFLLLLSSIDATIGMDKMLNETILFSFLLYTAITSFMAAFFPSFLFLPF